MKGTIKSKKLLTGLIVLTVLSTSNIFGEQSDFDRAMEIIFPFPIISIETGKPETFSFDLGIETLFIDFNNEGRMGTYICYSYSRSPDDNFNRFSGGLAFGFMGLMEMRGGCGYGLMPKNHDVLHTFFTELSVRLFLLEVKTVFERPLKPSDLVEYYNDRYKDGVKLKIGLSI